MADTVPITAGSGTSIATDDIGGVHYQRVKLSLGADGAATDIGIGQAAMAASIPVVIASNQGAVAVSGTLTAVTTVGTITNAVAVTDNSGSLTVDGTVAATQSGTWTVQPGNTANTTAWKVDGSAVTQPVSGTITANAGSGTLAVSLATVPSHAVTNAGTFAVQATVAATTTGGATASNVRSAASTNATNLKASAGTLFGWFFQNNGTVQQFVRLYNLSSAPTPASSSIFIGPIVLNPGDSVGQDYGPQGVAMGTGIGYAVSGGQSATDNTNATVDIVLGHIRWI